MTINATDTPRKSRALQLFDLYQEWIGPGDAKQRSAASFAKALGLPRQPVYRWLTQARVELGEDVAPTVPRRIPGLTVIACAKLALRLRELETELVAATEGGDGSKC